MICVVDVPVTATFSIVLSHLLAVCKPSFVAYVFAYDPVRLCFHMLYLYVQNTCILTSASINI